MIFTIINYGSLQSKHVAGISQIKMHIIVLTDRLFVLGHENRDYFPIHTALAVWFLGVLADLRKAIFSFVMSVRPSV